MSTNGTIWTTISESHGTSNAWVEQSVSLTPYVGGSIQLRFFFDTVDSISNNYEGWYVDDVTVLVASLYGVTITETGGSTDVAEDGASDAYTAVLMTQPTADVSVTNTDDDAAGITVSPTSRLVTTEGGGMDSFTVVLNTEPAADVTIGTSSDDTTEGTVDKASLTFTAGNWNVA